MLGKTYLVTGGARGLGLALAEALVEAGGRVYCLDRAEKPDVEWDEAQSRVSPREVSLSGLPGGDCESRLVPARAPQHLASSSWVAFTPLR